MGAVLSASSVATAGEALRGIGAGAEGRTISDETGVWRWDYTNASTDTAADEVTVGEGDGGLIVAPTGDKTGASGAFRRVQMGPALPSYYGAYPSVGDNQAALTAWMRNINIAGEPGTFSHSGTLYAAFGQHHTAGGMKLDYTGTGGVHFQFSGGVNHCRYEYLDLQSGDADVGLLFTTDIQGGGSGNCNFNEIRGLRVRGTARSGSLPSFTDVDDLTAGTTIGVRFDYQADHVTPYVVYFNKIHGGMVDRWDAAFAFRDGDGASHVSGANANHINDVDVQSSWYGYVFGGLENIVRGGYFNSSAGASGSELFTAYYFGPNAFGTDVVGASGEPGGFARPAYAETGSAHNDLDMPQAKNYTHGSTDNGTKNTILLKRTEQWDRVFTNLTENTYYRILLGPAQEKKISRILVNWNSHNLSTNGNGAGYFAAAVASSSSGVLTGSITENVVYEDTGLGSAKPFGIEIDTVDAEERAYLVIFVSNNLTATGSARFNCTISTPLGGDSWNGQEEVTALEDVDIT